MNITDEMVERAAEALYAAFPSGRYEYNNDVAWVTTTWEELLPRVKDIRRTQARAALTAALGDVVKEHAMTEQHPDDLAVDEFARRMKAKLAKKRADGRGGWEDRDHCSAEFLSRLLREHVEKGDPLDVGNFAMMLCIRGDRIAALADVEPLEDVLLNLHSDGYEVTYMGDSYVAEIYGPVDEPDPTSPFTHHRATLGWGEDEGIDTAIRAAVANATKGGEG